MAKPDDINWDDYFPQSPSDVVSNVVPLPSPTGKEEVRASDDDGRLTSHDSDDTGVLTERTTASTPSTPIPLTREDAHNGEYLEREFGRNVRFDHPTGRWYIWHKGAHRWRKDETEHVLLMTTNAAKRRAQDCINAGDNHKLKIAMALFSLAKRKAALEDLRFHPGIAVGQQFWDQDPDLLCVRNGVLELPSGVFRRGEQLDHVTKQSSVVYDPLATCPRWMTFLSEVFVSAEMVEYVRTIVGYCLTGRTTEQVWFLLYGTGGNGKSVFVSVLEALLGIGEYFEQAASDTFVVGHFGSSGGHNISQLRSARLVAATEVSEKASFDGARIKQLTGSDPVTAAAKYENNVTFVPALKLMMLVNHLPATRDDSFGFWRRLRPIPFEQTFTGSGADSHLLDALLAELPGILNWALSGASTWYASGLAPAPEAAVRLVEEYRAESDPLAMYIHECILITKNAADQIAARDVYRSYSAWCEANKKVTMTETNFGRSQTMKSLGLGKKSAATGLVYVGIQVFDPTATAHVVKMPKKTTIDD